METVKCRLDRFLAAQGRNKHLRMLIIATEFNIGDGYQFDTRVFEFAANQFRQFSLNLISKTSGTRGVLYHNESVRELSALA